MPRTQKGYVFENSTGFHVRFYLYSVKGKRTQRSHKLCDKNVSAPSKDSPAVLQLAADFMRGVNAAVASERSGCGHCCVVCGNRCPRTIAKKESN